MGLFSRLFRRKKREPKHTFAGDLIREDVSEDVQDYGAEVQNEQVPPVQEISKGIGRLLNRKTQKEREAERLMNEIHDLMRETNEKIGQIQNQVNKVDESIAHSQKSVEDKVHTEAVKIYRNIQAVLSEMETKVAQQDKMDMELQTIKNFLKGLVGVTAITLIILVFFVLFALGVF